MDGLLDHTEGRVSAEGVDREDLGGGVGVLDLGDHSAPLWSGPKDIFYFHEKTKFLLACAC